MCVFVRWPQFSTAVALLITVWSTAAYSQSRDPLVREVPTDRPPLRELLTGNEFETRFAAAVAKLGDWSRWDETKAPALGVRVNGVFPGSQVIGTIARGDILSHVDGQLLWGDTYPANELPRELRFYSESRNAIGTIRVEPGKLGVQPVVYWRPELLYLRSPNRNPAWDELVLVAIMNRGSDPDLAETALARAVGSGHPRDEVTAQIGAEIALMQNRPEVASDFAWFAEQELDSHPEMISRRLLLRVALANYHLENVLRLVQDDAAIFEDLHLGALKRLIELHKSRPESERLRPAPTVRAQEMYGDALVPRLIASNRLAAVRGMPLLRKGEPLQLKAGTAHYYRQSFEPVEPTPHFDMTFEFSATPEGTELSNYLRWFYVSLHGLNAPATASIDPLYRTEIIKLAISEFGDVQFLFGNTQAGFTVLDPTASGLTGKAHQLRVVRVGGQAEVFLNGHRIYYGPVPDDSPSVQIEFNVTGSEASVRLVDAAELVERE